MIIIDLIYARRARSYKTAPLPESREAGGKYYPSVAGCCRWYSFSSR